MGRGHRALDVLLYTSTSIQQRAEKIRIGCMRMNRERETRRDERKQAMVKKKKNALDL